MKVGLALSGGGSKGAYQVGMLKALVELGGQVDAVAGTSVGALNAAVIACSPSLDEAVDRLQRLWLKEVPYVSLVASGFSERLEERLKEALDPLDLLDLSLFSKEPVRELIAKYIDFKALADGLPLYVSVYKSKGGLRDFARWAMAEFGVLDTSKSEFVHIQTLSEKERIECLLASAALPIVFSAVDIGSSRYSDGGQGGWWTQQGNTPVEPLVDAGCDLILVMHAGEGSSWNRDEDTDTVVIEIHPTHPSTSGIKDLFERDEQIISSWIEQGYNDGKRTLLRIMEAVQSRKELRHSKDELGAARRSVEESERRRKQAEAHLASALSDLKRDLE